MDRVRRRATYDDVLAVPDQFVAEILDGELYTTPRPASPHAIASSNLTGDLNGSFGRPPGGSGGRPGGWWILVEPELHLGADVVVPDLAGWRRDRLPEIADIPAFTLAPDWVCEVISPSTAGVDRVKKAQIYAREGVSHFWLLDPIARTLEIHRLEQGRWLVALTHVGDEPLRAEPFDAIALNPRDWWLSPTPPTP
jgi:Uma2 family endonuclease